MKISNNRKKTTIQKRPERHKKFLLAALASSLAAGLLVVILALGLLTANLFERVHYLENWQLKTNITDSVNSLAREGAVGLNDGKVYLPEARLTLPAYPKDLYDRLEYSYQPAHDNEPAELTVRSRNALNMAASAISTENVEKMFQKVPELQACSRQYLLRSENEPAVGNYELVHEKQLTNGNALNIYRETGCGYKDSSFETYLKQIDSY